MSLKDLYREIVLHTWQLGFVEDPMESIINKEKDFKKVKYVKHHYKNRWWADPFILDYNDKEIYLLAEDFCDEDKKGKISKLVIDRETMKMKSVKIILEIDSHLSFPAILKRDNNSILFYPENSGGQGLVLYEYDMKTDICKEIKVLSKEKLTDAIITDYFGNQQIFSTSGSNANGKILEVYDYNKQDNEFILNSTIEFQENIARNAGDFFVYKGQLYRFAQECNYTYGHALSLQKIDYTNNRYNVTEVKRFLPPKGFGNIGVHTFNIYKDMKVIDVKSFRHPWIAVPLFKLRNVFKHR